ncbi:MAG: DUF1565 domain-containing protein [Rhodopirellula sp.]|nr:DUF1565 domain-containing protein [Rhodopirellula sp.]
MTIRLFALWVAIAVTPAFARDWYVNHETGADAATGEAQQPFRSIALAIKSAGPGDTIHLAPTGTPYREVASFYNKSGEAGRPITLDGHGAVLSGAEPLDPARWEQVTGGLYRGAPPVSGDAAVIGRWFFLIDGRVQRMGRSLKGPHSAWKAADALAPGQWTWNEKEGMFYLRTPGDRPLGECGIRAPIRSNGVALSGSCEHLVIRNLTATHVYNDGFNIHGYSRDILFENVLAVECGDDGISAHDDCTIEVRGMVSTGNSTGACHAGKSRTTSERMVIAGNHGYDYFVLNTGAHVLRDSRILCDAAQSLVVIGDQEEGAVCTLALDNVLLQGAGASSMIKANRNSVVNVSRCTFLNLSLPVAGESFSLRQSVVAGAPKPYIVIYEHTHWTAASNLYDLTYLRVGDTFYKPETFADYRTATGRDSDSLWTSVQFIDRSDGSFTPTEPVHEVGVIPSRLPEAIVSREADE